MKDLTLTILSEKLTEYKSLNGFNATHIFTFSEHQKKIINNHITKINGVQYTEMREFCYGFYYRFSDVKFVAVGTEKGTLFLWDLLYGSTISFQGKFN